jgi:serine protease Do
MRWVVTTATLLALGTAVSGCAPREPLRPFHEDPVTGRWVPGMPSPRPQAVAAAPPTPAAPSTSAATPPAKEKTSSPPAVATRQPAIPPARSDLKPVSSGTGFYVDHDGDVLTAWHVVDGCTQVVLIDFEPTRLISYDRQRDVALLQTRRTTGSFAVFRFSPAEPGETAYALGYPLLDTLWSINTTSGIVSSLSGPGGNQRVLQTTAPVQPGNSGGPLVDDTGNVIGVVVARLNEPEAQNVNYAVKVDQILPFARGAGVQLRTTDKGGSVDARKIARDGAAYTVPLLCLR